MCCGRPILLFVGVGGVHSPMYTDLGNNINARNVDI